MTTKQELLDLGSLRSQCKRFSDAALLVSERRGDGKFTIGEVKKMLRGEDALRAHMRDKGHTFSGGDDS